NALGAEHPQVDSGAERWPEAFDHDCADLIRQFGANPRQATPHSWRHRVAAFRPRERDSRNAPGNAQLKSGPGQVLDLALPLVAPPRPRSATPFSLRIRWMNP